MTDHQWVSWWCHAWRWMHPTWGSRQCHPLDNDFAACTGIWRSRHDALLTLLGIDPSPPPEAEPRVIEWLSLTEEQRVQALSLAQAICFTTSNDQSQLSSEQWSWCRSIAKALRPARWLPPEVTDPRAILAGWLGERFWTRVRLSWPVDEVPEPVFNVCPRKLDALWQSVLWRVRA